MNLLFHSGEKPHALNHSRIFKILGTSNENIYSGLDGESPIWYLSSLAEELVSCSILVYPSSMCWSTVNDVVTTVFWTVFASGRLYRCMNIFSKLDRNNHSNFSYRVEAEKVIHQIDSMSVELNLPEVVFPNSFNGTSISWPAVDPKYCSATNYALIEDSTSAKLRHFFI